MTALKVTITETRSGYTLRTVRGDGTVTHRTTGIATADEAARRARGILKLYGSIPVQWFGQDGKRRKVGER